jgi:hypothetical protein
MITPTVEEKVGLWVAYVVVHLVHSDVATTGELAVDIAAIDGPVLVGQHHTTAAG